MVKVHPIDTDALAALADEQLRAGGFLKEGESVRVYNAGVIFPESGAPLLLDSDAVAYTAEPYPVPIYRASKGTLYCAPEWSIRYTAKELREIPMKGEQDLVDFVRRFGARLEQNFHNLCRFLTNERGMDTREDVQARDAKAA